MWLLNQMVSRPDWTCGFKEEILIIALIKLTKLHSCTTLMNCEYV